MTERRPCSRVLGCWGNTIASIIFMVSTFNDNWAHHDEGRFGLFSHCLKINKSDPPPNADPKSDVHCEEYNMGEIEAYFHISRAFLCICIPLLVYGFFIGNAICDVNNDTIPRLRLGIISNIIQALLILTSQLSFEFNYEDDFDYEGLRLAWAFYLSRVTLCLLLVATFFMSWNLITKKWPRCKPMSKKMSKITDKCMICCGRKAPVASSSGTAGQLSSSTTTSSQSTTSQTATISTANRNSQSSTAKTSTASSVNRYSVFITAQTSTAPSVGTNNQTATSNTGGVEGASGIRSVPSNIFTVTSGGTAASSPSNIPTVCVGGATPMPLPASIYTVPPGGAPTSLSTDTYTVSAGGAMARPLPSSIYTVPIGGTSSLSPSNSLYTMATAGATPMPMPNLYTVTPGGTTAVPVPLSQMGPPPRYEEIDHWPVALFTPPPPYTETWEMDEFREDEKQ